MDWNSSVLWGITSIICGFFFSLLFYLIGREQKKVLFNSSLELIINDDVFNIDNLSIKYNNIEIKNLHKSTVTIKNIGNTTIEKDDFSINNPLLIKTGGIILSDYSDMRKISHNTSTVKWTFKPLSEENASALIIDFEYIPKKGEISFSILHTDYIDIDGILKEGRIIEQHTIMDILINLIKIIWSCVKYFIIGCLIGALLGVIVIYI